MAYCELKYYSPALQKATAATLILPETNLPGPFPVLYLLHGLSDDHTIWQRRTSIERYVQNLPLIIVMPDTGRGFYSDGKEGMAWETSLISDLIEFVDKMLPTIPTRTGRCLAGLSMGGYGAVKLALKHPDKFCAAVSHSGALEFVRRIDPSWDNYDEWVRIFGVSGVGGEDDCHALAEKIPVASRPALRIDCGTEDFLLDQNREFTAHLKSLKYPHEYAEFPGGHTWDYWDLHIREAISFLSKHIELPKAPPLTDQSLAK